MSLLNFKLPNLRRLESSVERAFVDGCENMGLRTRKMNGLGSRSWPDRMVLGPDRFVAFVELKRPGEFPTDLQKDMLLELGALGFPAAWTDDENEALLWLADLLLKHDALGTKEAP